MNSARPSPGTPVGLAEITALAGGVCAGADGEDVTVVGVSLDSRRVGPGDLYAALPGARHHGADFAAQVVAAGAVGILTDADGAQRIARAQVRIPLVVVADPRAILGQVSARVYGTDRLRPRMIGITGTNGKTTTAYLVASALDALGHTTGLIGTVETRVAGQRMPSARTTPEAPDLHALLAAMVQAGVDTCVMEVSSHALALHRVDGVVYDVAVFTNLTQDHLDFHASMQEYFLAKADLFSPARARQGIICVDDAYGVSLAKSAQIPVQTLGRADADWQLTADSDEPGSFTLRHGDAADHLRSALPGDFNMTNTALAAAILTGLGIAKDQVVTALARDPQVPGRMEVVSHPDYPADPRVIVDYAHTPEAIRAALGALRPSTQGQLICVTGAGGDRDRDKRAAMGAAAAMADVVVVTDDNPRSEDPAVIRRAVLEGALEQRAHGQRRVEVIEVGDRRSAIEAAIVRALKDGRGATVAVVGKGHERGQEVAGVVHPFDDRDEVLQALARVHEERS